MGKNEYNYDIAFSFLNQDEELALNLYDLVKDRLNCFIYTEQQKKLAGTDGEANFNSVFSKESRIVIILHRNEWGTTKWTRVEETAIRNRGFDNGYDFVLSIPLDNNPEPPSWLPKNRLWIGLKRWGIESAASVIEARVQEMGGTIKVNSIADKIVSIETGIKKQEDIDSFLDTHEGTIAASNEFKNVLEIFKSNVEEIKSKTTDWHLHVRNNKQNGIDLLSYGYELSIQYYSNPLDPYLFIAFSEGYFDKDGYATDPFNPVNIIDFKRYKFDINKFDQKGWSDLKTRKNYMTTSKLIDFWFGKLLKYATQNRMKK